jgi:hypoxanthine phosphoribosyltransferase
MTVRPDDSNQIIFYSWEDMDRLHRKVAQQIVAQGAVPDIILGIMRCGQVSAIHLSYILGVRKVASILVRTTPSDAPLTSERVEPEVTLHVPENYFLNQRVLLVDAVMESGTTAALCLRELEKYRPTEVKIAIIVDWYTSSYRIISGERPKIDFFGDRATLWPDFPWEH